MSKAMRPSRPRGPVVLLLAIAFAGSASSAHAQKTTNGGCTAGKCGTFGQCNYYYYPSGPQYNEFSKTFPHWMFMGQKLKVDSDLKASVSIRERPVEPSEGLFSCANYCHQGEDDEGARAKYCLACSLRAVHIG